MKPHLPPELTKAEVYAIKALAQGKADASAQVQALNLIIEKIARTYDQPYREDSDGGERATAFAAGKMHVGYQIRRIITQPIAMLVPDTTTTKGETDA